MDEDRSNRQRRPEWRGERRAVLVRLPVPDADRLAAYAERASQSMSETAADLIRRSMDEVGRP